MRSRWVVCSALALDFIVKYRIIGLSSSIIWGNSQSKIVGYKINDSYYDPCLQTLTHRSVI